MSLAILVKLNSYPAHSGSRLLDLPGMRSQRTHAIFPLDLGAYFLEIGQGIRNSSVDLSKSHPVEFFQYVFRLASVEEPAVNRTHRNPLSGEASTPSAGSRSLHDKPTDFHNRILAWTSRRCKEVSTACRNKILSFVMS